MGAAVGAGGTAKTRRIGKDVLVLAKFIEVFCRGRHAGAVRERLSAPGPLGEHLAAARVALCPECRKLLLHAASKRMICPYDPKPRCKKCPTHCYAPGYRDWIREVMRYSGIRLVLRGRLDWAWKYFF